MLVTTILTIMYPSPLIAPPPLPHLPLLPYQKRTLASQLHELRRFMKFPPKDFLTALLHDETATAAAIDTTRYQHYKSVVPRCCFIISCLPRHYSARSPGPHQPPPPPVPLPRLVACCCSPPLCCCSPPLLLPRSPAVRKLMRLRGGVGLSRRISCGVYWCLCSFRAGVVGTVGR